MVNYYTFSAGTTAVASEVNTNFGVVSKWGNIKSCSSPLGRSDYNHAFTSDDASTKTNFTYNTSRDDYTCLGTNAGVLVTAVVNQEWAGNSIGYSIACADIKWDFYIFTVYDETNNSSVDTDKWTQVDNGCTGTLTEDTERISNDISSPAESGGDYIGLATDETNGVFTTETVVSYIYITAGSSVQNCTVSLNIYDGSSLVTIETLQALGPLAPTISGLYVFKFNSTAKTVYVWKNGALVSGSPFDLSSLTKYQIFGKSKLDSNDSFSGAVRFYALRKITGSETSTAVESFSSDNGSNYTTASVGTAYITSSANRGYLMKARLTSTPASGEGISVNRVDFQGFTLND